MGQLSVLFVAAVFAGVAFACQPPDCDTPDCGSCANACCDIEFSYNNIHSKDIMMAIVETLQAGGPDMRYTYVNTSDMTSSGGKAQYLIQAIHRTLVNHYNDTVDILIIAESENITVVRAFSISRIWGAYCDEGQNYKNIVGLAKSPTFTPWDRMAIVHGCTNKKNSLDRMLNAL